MSESRMSPRQKGEAMRYCVHEDELRALQARRHRPRQLCRLLDSAAWRPVRRRAPTRIRARRRPDSPLGGEIERLFGPAEALGVLVLGKHHASVRRAYSARCAGGAVTIYGLRSSQDARRLSPGPPWLRGIDVVLREVEPQSSRAALFGQGARLLKVTLRDVLFAVAQIGIGRAQAPSAPLQRTRVDIVDVSLCRQDHRLRLFAFANTRA